MLLGPAPLNEGVGSGRPDTSCVRVWSGHVDSGLTRWSHVLVSASTVVQHVSMGAVKGALHCTVTRPSLEACVRP